MSKSENARLRSIFGFTRNVIGLALNHEREMAKIGSSLIKSLPVTEEHIDKVIGLSEQAQEHAHAVEDAANAFAMQIFTSETVKECAAKICIAATDRIVRSLKEQPLPHEKAVEKAYSQGYDAGSTAAR